MSHEENGTRHAISENLRRERDILEAGSMVARRLLRAASLQESIPQVLADLAQAMGVDRAFVLEHHAGSGSPTPVSRFWAWQIGPDGLQEHRFQQNTSSPHSESFLPVQQALLRGELLQQHTRDFPRHEQELLAAQGIKSVIMVPVMPNEAWWGLVSLAETRVERVWSPGETNGLRTVADLFAAVIEQEQGEEALRQSEARYRKLVESSPDGICLHRDGTLVYINPAGAAILGAESPAQLIGRSIYGLTDPSYHPQMRQRVQALEREGDAVPLVGLRIRRMDGSIGDIEVVSSAVMNDSRPTLQTVFRDITDRQRAEALAYVQRDLALALSAEIPMAQALRLVVEAAMHVAQMDCGGIYLVDAASGALDLAYHTGLSESFVSATSHHEPGHAFVSLTMRGEPTYTTYTSLVPSLGREQAGENLRALAVIPVSYRGQVIACLNVASHILESVPLSARDALEAVGSSVGVAIARIRSEEQLRATRDELQRLMACSPVMLYCAETSGVSGTTFMSQNVRAQLGYAPEDFTSDPLFWLHHIHPDDVPRVLEGLSRLSEHKGVYTHEYRFRHRDGTWRWMQDEMTLLPTADGRIEVVGFWRDFTGSKQMEDALRESEERYRRLVEVAPEAIGVAVDGVAVFINAAGVDILGAHSASEIIGRAVLDFVHPAYREQAGQRITAACSGAARSPMIEEDFLRLDGTVVPVEVAVTAITNRGRPAVQVIFRDITGRVRAREQLRRREREMRTLIDNLPAQVFFQDIHGVYVLVNRLVAEEFGVPAEEFVGKTDYDLMPSELAETYMDYDRQLFDSGMLQHVEFEVPALPGAPSAGRVLDIRKVPLRDDRGKITGFVGIALDITERVRAREQLRQRERDLRTLIDNLPAQVFFLDAHGVYVLVNKRVADDFGVPAEEFVGKTDYDLMPGDLAKAYANYDRQLFDSGMPLHMEFEVPDLPGAPSVGRVLDIREVPLKDDSGTITGLVGIALDITERVRAERALRESEERYRTLVETSPDSISVTDLDGRFLMVNEQAARLNGYASGREMIARGVTAFDLFIPEDRARAIENARKTLTSGTVLGAEYTLLLSDGSKVPVEISAAVLRGADGRPVGFVGVTRNIAERLRAEAALHESQQRLQQAQRLEALEQMAVGVAHDFGNLLAVIQGRCEYMSETLSEESPVYEDIHEIAQVSAQGAVFLRQLVAFGRGQPMEVEILHLNRLIRDAAGILRSILGETITLDLCLADPPVFVWGDGDQLNRVLMNLAINAHDAMPMGGRLEISTEACCLDAATAQQMSIGPGPYARMLVRDTGRGISEEHLEHIFDPFFTTKGYKTGSGLGLSVVYGIMQRHKGRVIAKSSPGQGTSFLLYFPAVDTDDIEEEQANSSAR